MTKKRVRKMERTVRRLERKRNRMEVGQSEVQTKEKTQPIRDSEMTDV